MTRVLPIAALVLALLCAGCGSGGKRIDGVPDAAKVQRTFTAMTGIKLVTAHRGDTTWLSPAVGQDTGRLGQLQIVVARTEAARKQALSDINGGLAARGSGSVYETDPSPTKDYGHGVLVTDNLLVAREGDDRSAIGALDRVMRAAIAGKPSLLPAAERPCAAVGIDLQQGKEGSCVEDGTPVTVVDSTGTLKVADGQGLSLVGTDTSIDVPQVYDVRTPHRANGALLLVRFRVDGTRSRDAAEQLLAQTRLVVGDKHYDQSALTFRLDPSPIAVGPGVAVTDTVAFDLPPAAVAPALDHGQLVITKADAGEARIRLAGAPTAKLPKTIPVPSGR